MKNNLLTLKKYSQMNESKQEQFIDAVEKADIDYMKILLPDIDINDSTEVDEEVHMTPLKAALNAGFRGKDNSNYNNVDVVKFLLDNGAVVDNEVDADDMDLLDYCFEDPYDETLEVAKLLIDAGVKITDKHIKTYLVKNPRHFAETKQYIVDFIYTEYPEMIDDLIKRGSDLK